LEKVALIELGINNVKLILAHAVMEQSFVVYDEISEPLKIGRDLERDGFIKPTQIAEAITVLKMFRKLCDSEGVTRTTAYATYSVREAKNQRSFIEELEMVSGFKFRVLSPQEEGSAIYTGVINTLDVPKAVIVYIDENTTQLIQYSRRNILQQEIIPFGTGTLSELFLENGSNTEAQSKIMTEFFAKQLAGLSWLKTIEDEFKFVGVGKTFASLGKLSRKGKKYPLDLANNYRMNSADINNVFGAVKALEMDKETKLKGTSTNAYELLAGLSMVSAFVNNYKMNELVISDYGMSTGMLYNYVISSTNEKPISDLLGYSLETINTFYPSPRKNTRHIYELCLILFRQLKVLHKLSRHYVRPLKIAAYMYACGARIGFNGSTKVAYSVVLNSQIYGASHRDIVIGAFIAASQNADDFNLGEWVRYKDILLEEDLDALRKLAAIVRIASGLDRTQHAYIKDIVCDVLGDSVIMKTITEADVSFEIKCAAAAAHDFKRAYRKNLELL